MWVARDIFYVSGGSFLGFGRNWASLGFNGPTASMAMGAKTTGLLAQENGLGWDCLISVNFF